jgi:hypothetical protein
MGYPLQHLQSGSGSGDQGKVTHLAGEAAALQAKGLADELA